MKSPDFDASDVVDTANIDIENFSFRTRSIVLRYKKPLYTLDDIFNFKMELEAFPEIDANEIYIECELLHSPLNINPNEEVSDKYEQVKQNE